MLPQVILILMENHWLQVSVYDTINKDAQYSLKVRRLGEYHPGLAATKDQEGQDIGDPLYGNVGGVDELVADYYPCHICLSRPFHSTKESRLVG